jgi:hypothetical protein
MIEMLNTPPLPQMSFVQDTLQVTIHCLHGSSQALIDILPKKKKREKNIVVVNARKSSSGGYFQLVSLKYWI